MPVQADARPSSEILALDRVVRKEAIFVSVGGRKVIMNALCRSTDAGDIPNGALLFGGIAARRGFGYRSRACVQDDRRECQCKEVSHGAIHGCRIEVLDCNGILHQVPAIPDPISV
jgi:hypothetical protein